MQFQKNLCRSLLRSFIFLVVVSGISEYALAAQITISWSDNSSNEDGFRIERRAGTSGSYQHIATLASNTSSYADVSLPNGVTYCYRVVAFNSAGNSPFSNENCATTPSSTGNLTITRAGTGSGTVTSSPAGINCGTDCTNSYTAGSTVILSASAGSGSVFAGWSGPADCADGNVTVTAALTCTANFNTAAAPSYTLTTIVINEVSSGGAASGRLVSSPGGIDCGSDCTENYPAGKTVTLTPIAAANSKFAGWGGDSDCSGGMVMMTAAKHCTAKFQLNSAILSVSKKGKGDIKAAGAAIDCGSSCVYIGAIRSVVTLRATAEPGAVFTGWSGGCSGTGDCTVTLLGDTTVTANFAFPSGDKIGLYRPQEGNWYLDRDGSGSWDECSVDLCVQLSGGSGTVPVVGDWTNSGNTKVGFFVSQSSEWFLDANGNGVWDGCQIDICSSFGEPDDVPISGRWVLGSEDRVAVFRPARKRWYLDRNGNEILDRCKIDKCPVLEVYEHGDIPITGDWLGHGISRLGLYRPRTGQWFLDRGVRANWSGCKKELCFTSFGSPGDIPVAGDWDGSGVSRIGVFRAATGEWFLDINGNGRWDGAAVDRYVAGFGQPGDIPVVGKW